MKPSLEHAGQDHNTLTQVSTITACWQVAMSAELANAMKACNSFIIVFDDTKAKSFTVGLPLAGFTAACNKMSGGS